MECGHETNGLLGRWSLFKIYRQLQNGRVMDHLDGIELDKRYEAWQQSATKHSSNPRSRSIMNLVIAEYMKTRPQEGQYLDPEFRKWATIQIRLFLFVRHDSEATTIIYSLYLLSKHPAILPKVRAEHGEVFGIGVSSAIEKLSEYPEMINQLLYTLAVIKETLRLFPATNGLRGGLPGISLRAEDGKFSH